MQGVPEEVELTCQEALGGVLVLKLERAVQPSRVDGSIGSWLPGPLPVRMPVKDDLRDRLTASSTTQEARRTVIDGGADELLYAPAEPAASDGPLAGRHHIPRVTGNSGSLTFFAAEFLSRPVLDMGVDVETGPDSALLAIHFIGTQPDSPAFAEKAYLGDASSMRRLRFWNPHLEGGQSREWTDFLVFLGGVVPVGWELTKERSRIVSLTYVPEPGPSATRMLEPDHLQYMLVAGIPESKIQAPEERLAELRLQPRKIGWHALVMRDGISFSLPRDDSFALLKVYCHTIFLDVLLLVWTQRSAIAELKREFRSRSVADAEELLKLEIAYFNFKRTTWFESMTLAKTKPTDDILNKLQTQFHMQEDEQRFSSDVVESSRLASSVQAQRAAERAKQAALQSRKTQLAQDRTNTSIQVLTAVLAPLGLSYTGTAVLLEPSGQAFWIATLIGIGSTSILLFAGYLQRWWHRQDRSEGRL